MERLRTSTDAVSGPGQQLAQQLHYLKLLKVELLKGVCARDVGLEATGGGATSGDRN